MNPNTQRRESARNLLDAGRTGDALSLLARNIEEFPRDADSIYLSGVCHARSGDYAAAEKLFSKAVKLNRDLFQAYSDLGLAQSRQHKFSLAIKSFRKALAKNPRFAPAHSQLALAYLQTQQPAKALKHAGEAVAIDGGNPSLQNIQGLCYRQLGHTDRAIDTFERIFANNPDFYGTLHNLYETYRLADDTGNAEKVLLRAKAAFGDQAIVYLTLGKFYEQTQRADAARILYAQGISHCANNIDLRTALARVNRQLGYIDEGLEQIEQALAENIQYQPALAERCSFHILQGEYEAAYTLLDRFVSSHRDVPLSPGLAIAYAHACRLTGRHDASIGMLQSALEDSAITEEMKSVVHFALGDSHDKLGHYERAFPMYRKANGVAAQASDIARYLGLMRDISDSIDSAELNTTTRADTASCRPVFILGMPRSGTSLAEQILASHPRVHGAGEITELWAISQDICDSTHLACYPEKLAALSDGQIKRYAERYLAYIGKLDPDALRITDKLPHNFMHIGLIRRLFPDAHIIHCHRHPFDTCLSIYFKRFNDNHLYARNLSDIAQFYQAYTDLMDRWKKTSTPIFSLKYEDLVNDPEQRSRELVSHIGLEWDDRCLRYYESDRLINTPSYTQANQPVYTDSMNRWKHYRKHLQPLVDVLGDPEQYE